MVFDYLPTVAVTGRTWVDSLHHVPRLGAHLPRFSLRGAGGVGVAGVALGSLDLASEELPQKATRAAELRHDTVVPGPSNCP